MSIHFDSRQVETEGSPFQVDYYLLENPSGCGIRLVQTGPGANRMTDEVSNLGICRPFAEEILGLLAEGGVLPGLLRETICELLYCKVNA